MSGFDSTRFDALLAQEITLTERTYQESVNTHAYFIARKALWLTRKADATQIRTQLEGPAQYTDGTLAEAILIARYNKQGGWPNSAAAFTSDIKRLIAARVRSVAFLKSGWIPAIQTLELVTKSKSRAAPLDREARVYGLPKGRATPAAQGQIMAAVLENRAGTENPSSAKALHRYGAPALEAAFYDECNQMQIYIERKLTEQFEAANRNL